MLILVIFCLIQGFTEFLPISSQGHLIVFNNFFPLTLSETTKLSILELNILAHFGSLIAIMLYYSKYLKGFLISSKFIFRPDIDARSNLLINLIFSSIPVFIFGFYFESFFNLFADQLLLVISITSIFFGVLLYLTDRFCLRIKNLDNLRRSSSFFIGISQCFALVPGVSRSGAVITYMRFNGFTRQHSVLYNNLMSIPVLFGAIIYLVMKNFEQITGNIYFNIIGFSVIIFSFLFSIIFIHLLVIWIKKFSFLIFVIYRILFGFSLLFFVVF